MQPRVLDTSRVTEADADKVRSTLRQCMRDWSAEVGGVRGRAVCGGRLTCAAWRAPCRAKLSGTNATGPFWTSSCAASPLNGTLDAPRNACVSPASPWPGPDHIPTEARSVCLSLALG